MSLSPGRPTLTAVTVGLRWDLWDSTGAEADLDASALLLGADGRVRTDHDFVFFNNLRSPDGWVEHHGDNMGGTDGDDDDDEQIIMTLTRVPADVHRIAIAVSIHDAEARGHTFGQVGNAVLRVTGSDRKIGDLARIHLTGDFPSDTALVVGEMYRTATTWAFRVVGRGYPSLREIAVDHGVDV